MKATGLSKILLKTGLMYLCLLVGGQAFTQTSNISGVVNTYHRVTNMVYSKACVRVASTTGLVQYQKAMLIQMKGATVDLTNASTFGDTTALNGAGNYELVTICNIVDDSVFFFFDLLNTYDVASKVQLVGIPVYYNATVTGTLRATPWDNTSGTGGVVAISVEEDLVLNAPINADSAGFKGGEYRLSSGTCFPTATQWFYNANNLNPQNGAFKGESVYDFSATYSGGRGAPANGGGGGNNHNNGGGGGANLAAGGISGGNYSSTGCLGSNPGRGGKPLRSHGGKKIFFGGGGGAGHSNNNTSTFGWGGDGGGIVFIEATTIAGNGFSISSIGQNGGNILSDGAGGGGAGGSIILDITTVNSGFTVNASGGNGGQVDNGTNAQRCYGSGGGGGGGVIHFNTAVPAGVTTNVTGGPAGLTINNDPACNAPVWSSPGSNGSVIPNYAYRASLGPASDCYNLLPITILYFNAHEKNQKSVLSWKFSDEAGPVTVEKKFGNNWIAIATIASNQDLTFTYTDYNPSKGANHYRISYMESGRKYYSAERKVMIDGINVRIIPIPSAGEVTITGITTLSTIYVSDVSGKRILHAISNGTSYTIKKLPPGMYFVTVNGQTSKLVFR